MKGTYHGHFWRTLQTQLQQSHRQAQAMYLLDELHCCSEARAKGNPAHQMRYSVELLEATLHSNGTPHVLQLNSKEKTSEILPFGHCTPMGNA